MCYDKTFVFINLPKTVCVGEGFAEPKMQLTNFIGHKCTSFIFTIESVQQFLGFFLNVNILIKLSTVKNWTKECSKMFSILKHLGIFQKKLYLFLSRI